MAEFFGQYDQGSIGQVHGEIGVFLHEFPHLSGMAFIQIDYANGIVGNLLKQQALR
jgi:hypothetical protein